MTKHDTIRHDTGVVLLHIHGDQVEAGEPLAEVHAGSEAAAAAAATAMLAAVEWSEGAPSPRTLVLEHVG